MCIGTVEALLIKIIGMIDITTKQGPVVDLRSVTLTSLHVAGQRSYNPQY